MSKTLLRILPLFTALFLFSCTKEEVTPTTPGVPSMVQVEYRVYAASSNAVIYAMLPVAGQANLTEQVIDLTRMTYTQTFEVKTGTEVSITAKNANPGSEEVTAEIYVNGNLLATASANAPGQSAVATGTAK